MFVRLAGTLFIGRTNIPLRRSAFAARRCPPWKGDDQLCSPKPMVSGLLFYHNLRSNQNLVHDLSVNVRQAEVAALEGIDEPFVVEAEGIEERGLEVVDVDTA